MFRSSPLAFLLFFALTAVHARVAPRQAAAGQPTMLTTVHNTETPLGVMVETCNVVLTPIKDAQGNDLVEEVTTCTLTMSGSGGASASSSDPSTSPSNASSNSVPAASQSPSTDALPAASSTSLPDATPTTPQTSATDAPPATTPTSSTDAPPADPSASAPDTPPGTSPTPAPSSGSLPAPSASISALDVPPSPTDAVPAESSAPTPVAASPTAIASPNVPGPSGTATKDASTAPQNSALGDAAAASTPTVAAAFVLPGKQLSVLPIGLGVFGGISVLGLIVVAFVTYERTKYRRDFREKQMAEAKLYGGYGANMA